jgi:hypothetical protein
MKFDLMIPENKYGDKSNYLPRPETCPKLFEDAGNELKVLKVLG